MIWLRLAIMAFACLFAVYYAMVLAQVFTNGNFRITNRKITFGRCLTPFYYWIAPQSEAPKKKKASEELNKKYKELLDRKEREAEEKLNRDIAGEEQA